MKLKLFLMFNILLCLNMNIFSVEKILKFDVVVPNKKSNTLTEAVLSSDVINVCCAYKYGANYSVDDNGVIKIISDNTFSILQEDLQTTNTKTYTINGKLCSYSKITFKYTQNVQSKSQSLKGTSSGIQSYVVLREAMIDAIKKTKKYKSIKKTKKGFSGMIYPSNNLQLKIGTLKISLSETFNITVK